ncbi:MAG: hypothetical protein A3F90_18710 [Deltaproteobacteria bacterium RIFCSPLOWO2_12_FULL_60_19]|nr:MAG: hypothetical protein A3F90_18710 [Deltaproteobacteria bacterium RIFCSPLOWO2_12_FULL_60_19]
MKTRRRKNIKSAGGRNKRVRRPLKTKAKNKIVQTTIDTALFQQEAVRAWVENAGVGGVEDLYAR